MSTPPTSPLWTCPACGRTFAQTNQSHTCRPLGGLDDHFAGCEPSVRMIFDRLRAEVEPVDVLPESTRIAFHLRMSFAAFMPRRRWLNGHLVLARTAAHPMITTVQVFSPRNVLHAFRLTELPDPQFLALLREARAVGMQEHLGRP